MNTAKLNESPKQTVFTADMVRTYLHEIGKVPLLTHEQEIVFGKQVQKMVSLLETKADISQKLGH